MLHLEKVWVWRVLLLVEKVLKISIVLASLHLQRLQSFGAGGTLCRPNNRIPP